MISRAFFRDSSVKSGELYQAYRAYCLRTGEYTRSTTDFYSELLKRGFFRQRRHSGYEINGLKLKEDDFACPSGER